MRKIIEVMKLLLADNLVKAAVLAVAALAASRWVWAPSPEVVEGLWVALCLALGVAVGNAAGSGLTRRAMVADAASSEPLVCVLEDSDERATARVVLYVTPEGARSFRESPLFKPYVQD